MSDKILTEAEYWKERSRLAEEYITGSDPRAYSSWNRFASNEPIPMPAAPRSEWISVREATFIEAAKAVCSFCSGNSFPNDKSAHAVQGPNSAGNYIHNHNGDDRLCDASSIWVRINWDRRERATAPPSIPQGEEQTEQP